MGRILALSVLLRTLLLFARTDMRVISSESGGQGVRQIFFQYGPRAWLIISREILS